MIIDSAATKQIRKSSSFILLVFVIVASNQVTAFVNKGKNEKSRCFFLFFHDLFSSLNSHLKHIN